MGNYLKHTEGRTTLFLVPVKEDEEGTIYLDATKVVKPALNKDRRQRYESEKGPNFAIEITRAIEYAEYLAECNLTSRNYHRFSTRHGYNLFLKADV